MVQALVGGQRVGDQRSSSPRADRHARVELHGRDGHLAGALVGHAEDGAVEHGGMAVQHGLDLGRGDLERR